MTSATTVSMERQIEHLTAQVERLVAAAERRDAERQRWSELARDLGPVASDAMESLASNLEQAQVRGEDLRRLTMTFASAVPTLERLLAQLGPLSELGQAASEITGPAMQLLTSRLDEAERNGWFGFARGARGVAERVVGSFGEQDVEALGDNIVLILETVRDMTQPEVMGMLRRTMRTVQHSEVSADPPSMLELLRDMRDPDVRRGFGRLIAAVRTMGEDQPSPEAAQSVTKEIQS